MPDGEEATMVALNKLTSETIWKSQVPDRAGGGQNQNRGSGGRNRPSAMQTDPRAFNAGQDKSKDISPDDLAAAPSALLTLDKKPGRETF